MLTINFNTELNKYLDDSSLCSDGQPEFVLFLGGVGAGKTTVRRQQYQNGYVHLDAAEIFANFANGEYYDFPDAFAEPLELMGSLIASKAVKEKRNIVMEVIGDSREDIEAINEAMKMVGYQTRLAFIDCDPDEANKRHRHAVRTDVNYISAFYTQPFHVKWLLGAVKEILEEK